MSDQRDSQQPPQWQAPAGPGWSLTRPDDQAPHGTRAPWPGQAHPTMPAPGWHPSAPPPTQPPSIDDYSLPPSRAKWWLGLVALVVVGALVWAGVRASRNEVPPLATTTPSTPAAPRPSTPGPDPSAKMNSFVSEVDGAEGTWQITKSAWTDRGLELHITISVTRGDFGYTFFCLDNATVTSHDPVAITDADALAPGRIGQGETVSGLVVFAKDRGDTTVYLANRYGRQISALPVNG